MQISLGLVWDNIHRNLPSDWNRLDVNYQLNSNITLVVSNRKLEYYDKFLFLLVVPD